jgi:hypothetical protein
MVDLRISARRIEGFLLAEEVEPLPALVAAGAAGGGGGDGGGQRVQAAQGPGFG